MSPPLVPTRSGALALCLAFVAVSFGCTVGMPDEDAGLDAEPPRADAGPLPDAGPLRDVGPLPDGNPFDPDASCGSTVVETEALPGSVLLVFDRSGSMDRPIADGASETRWQVSGRAIGAILDDVSGDARVGMLLFPAASQSSCNVFLDSSVPQVPIGPLSETRAGIDARLAAVPDGSATPIFSALNAGWDHLDALGGRGERAVVLVTDGAENCSDDARDPTIARSAAELLEGHLTFVVGINHSDSDLSALALGGGTPRSPDCIAECTTPACVVDSDDPCPETGAACTTFPEGETGGRAVGFCGCLDGDDCPSGMTCEDVDGTLACTGPTQCCHRVVSSGDFEAELSAALRAVAERVLTGCRFDLPRGPNPEEFDPRLVNVRVSINGEEAEVLIRSDDPSVDSWDYTNEDHESIELQGPLCDEIQENEASVEIVLGCPTVLI